MEYDLIGDIHGNAAALEELLANLDYRKSGLGWSSPQGRKIIFVGDFIDRGSDQVEVIQIARELFESGRALAVMGNHELNAIAWYFGHRPDTPKNRKQHQAFLEQIDERSQSHREAIEWFQTLPLWLDLPEIRVVHACWHPQALKTLSKELDGTTLSEDQIEQATTGASNAFDASGRRGKENEIFSAVETLLKGIEVALPHPHSFHDKDGHERRHVRLKWWLRPPASYREASMTKLDPNEAAFENPVPDGVLPSYDNLKPLFLGHYWQTGSPEPLTPKIACVDYSAGKGGPLVAYRWRGEDELGVEGFVAADPLPAVRPERFAWDDEEAQALFGTPRQGESMINPADSGHKSPGAGRILVAGRRDKQSRGIRSALDEARNAPTDRFVILELADQDYMQCLCTENGWILEKREGRADRHFRGLAKRTKSEADTHAEDLMARLFKNKEEPIPYLEFQQVLEAMSRYKEGLPDPLWLQWEPVEI